MPSIGPLEILVVGVVALIVFGPERLPQIARSFGRALSEFKRQANDIRSEFESSFDDVEDAAEPADEPPVVHKPKPRPLPTAEGVEVDDGPPPEGSDRALGDGAPGDGAPGDGAPPDPGE